MQAFIYDKTEKGREEIATRKYQLPARLRTLLVMIDGRHSLEDVLHKIGGLGLNGESVSLLLQQDYIHLVAGNEPEEESDAPRPTARSLRTKQRPPARPVGSLEALEAGFEEAEAYRAVQEFYEETIKQALGLRGIVLQMKVDKAATMEEFRSLRDPYLEALQKAKGEEMARSLVDRLDKLLA